MHPEKGFTLKESNYRDLMARILQVIETLNWELFCEKRPSVDEELIHEFYANLTSSEMTKVPVRGIRRSGTAHFLFTIIILCLKAEILANIRKTGYSKGTIMDWEIYRVAGDSVLQKQVEVNEELEDPDKEENPTVQSFEVPDKVESVEPEVEPNAETSMFRAQPPSPDLRDELSKLMDLMQHMQWQQQAYWRYSKIRDDSMRSAFKKIYNDSFIFVPEFPDFILNHGVHYQRRSKAIHAKAIVMEQKMSQI
ncbi:hypothetical protein PVK06_008653 [Gossypium arboreum]|uniref:Uncharacterized protein n=1 Tax=Gossypium arboreum TaxID=29729 RepID=A0ABR0QLU1_GOSAR|nr:hypothetical protein PVK06_008653 [Gossypium arboreum]